MVTIRVFLMWYKKFDLLQKCLGSIRKADPDLPVEIMQNGKIESGVPTGLNSQYSDDNLGCALGRNKMTENFDDDVFLFFDDDTELTGNIGQKIAAYFADPAVAAVGHTGIMFDPSMRQYTIQTKGGEVDAVTGYCFAIRSKIFKGLGGFDGAYGLYGNEDLDLCLRVKMANLGKIIADWSFPIVHLEHATFKRLDQNLMKKTLSRNQRLIEERYLGMPNLLEIDRKGIDSLACANCDDRWNRNVQGTASLTHSHDKIG